MHKLNLPTDYCVTACEMVTICPDGTATGARVGVLDPKAAQDSSNLVYQNVSKVIWSALAIEKLMNRIVLNHYFPKEMFKQSYDF